MMTLFTSTLFWLLLQSGSSQTFLKLLITPSCRSNSPCNWKASFSDVHCTDISYSASTTDTRSALTSVPFSISCSGGFNALTSHIAKPQQVFVTDDTCQLLLNYGYSFNNNFMFEAAYDSLRKFVETCPLHKSAYEAFPETGLSVNRMEGDDSLRYEEYHQWLISVLYLNTIDYKYYCADVTQIMNSMGYRKGYERAFFSVLRYLLDHPKCSSLGLQRLWNDSWASLRYDWWKGDTTVPFDSTWPSLDSIGLGFLTKLDISHEKPVLSSVYLGAASVVPNPMTGSTTLKYELLRSGFIGYTVHDELGNQVFARKSDYATAGKHEEQITLPPNLSSGTYYLRLNVGFGEIRAIRMVVVK